VSTPTLTTRTRFTPAAVTLTLLIGLNLLNYVDRYILPGEVTLVQREFHSTDQQMGLLTTAMFVVYMLAAPLTGWLGDHFRRKPLIIAGALLWSVATLGTAWVHDYRTLFIRHAIVGVGEATFGILPPPCWLTSTPSVIATGSCPSSISPFPWARRWATWPAERSVQHEVGARRFLSAPFPAW